jgi:hypothetical protein
MEHWNETKRRYVEGSIASSYNWKVNIGARLVQPARCPRTPERSKALQGNPGNENNKDLWVYVELRIEDVRNTYGEHVGG